MWKGSTRKYQGDEQAYYTSDELADVVTRLAIRVAPKGAMFVDVGVGAGALYRRLPSPKMGIELATTLAPKLPGVQYGVDALHWSPPQTWRKKHVVVVCNPPFSKQVAILNQCGTWECASLRVVWIAGLSVRNWDTEDTIDAHLHLEGEWLTPPEMSTFSTSSGPKQIRTVVQVWRREAAPRARWVDIPFPLQFDLETAKVEQANVFMTRVNSLCQVGSAGALPRDVRVENGSAQLTTRGVERVRRSLPPWCADRTSHSLGTVRKWYGTSGTAMGIRCAQPDLLVEHILDLRAKGIFYHLLHYRNTSSGMVSLSIGMLRRMLSPAWRRLARPIEFLDGVRRSEVQW